MAALTKRYHVPTTNDRLFNWVNKNGVKLQGRLLPRSTPSRADH